MEKDHSGSQVSPNTEMSFSDGARPLMWDADRYRLAIEASGMGLWSWDLQSDQIELDLPAKVMLGVSSSQQDDLSTLVNRVHPDDSAIVQSAMDLAKSGAGALNCEFRVWGNGPVRWLSAKGRKDELALAPMLVGVLMDVTDRKAAEAGASDAREATELLEAVIEAVPALIFVKDRSGRLQVANRAVAGLVGKPWEQFRNLTDAQFLDDPVQAAKIMATDRRLMEDGVSEEVEEIVGHDAEGPRIWLSQKTAFRGSDGVVRGLVGTSVDITARKRAEEKALASQLLLRRVIDNMFAFVGVMELDGTLVEANRAQVEGAGLTFADVLGRPFWDAHWWSHDPETRARIRTAAEKARAGETSRFDVEIAWRDNRRITIDFQIAPLRNDLGEVIKLIPSGVDITARQQAEAERKTLLRELDHRVANLFMVASSMVALSARGAASASDLAQVVIGRLRAMAYAHSLIRPAVKGEMKRERLGLRELIVTVATPHMVAPTTQLIARGPAVELTGATPTSLALVFYELATNAAKYGALSVAEGRLEVEWSISDGDLVLDWSETGGPSIESAPARKGFGSALMISTLQGPLGGTLTYDWAPSGLRVHLAAKLGGSSASG